MKYYTIPPSASLAPFVRFFWVFEGEGISREMPYIYRSMADGCAEILFHYQGTFQEITATGRQATFRAGVHAQSDAYRRFIIYEGFGIFGAYLYPFALKSFFDTPAGALSNLMPDLSVLIGKQAGELEDRIMSAANNEARVSILSDFLEKRLSSSQTADIQMADALHQILRNNGEIRIKAMSDYYGISIRQFQRRFKEIAGFSPKTYARITRFGHAMNHYGGTYRSLTDLAYACGYYDQSHFIQEFRQFSGYTPSSFFSGKAEGIEWRGES